MGRVLFGELSDDLKAVAVVMAGGQGMRFWPASRRSYPKQFLSLGVEKASLIQSTVQRVESLTSRQGVLIVAGESQRELVELQLPGVAVLAEPMGRNTAPCIGFAAVQILKTVGDVPMICLPADHYITDNEKVLEILRIGVDVARSEDLLVTIGIKPQVPETGYGYIQVEKRELAQNINFAHKILRFVEKPNLEAAKKYIDSGDYFWNSGMFVWRPSVVLSAIDSCLPELGQQLRAIEKVLGSERELESVSTIFSEIHPVSIDSGVMEKVDNAVMLPGETFQWSDVGSWGAWADCLKQQGDGDTNGNVVSGDSLVLDCNDSVIVSNKRFIAGVGLDNVIVVETDDAVLVCHRDNVQDVKKVVEELSRKRRTELL